MRLTAPPELVEGLRLRLLKQQAEVGDITVLFGDEAEALTHPDLAHAWAKRGEDLRVTAPGQSRQRAMLGVLDFATRRLIVNTSTTKRSRDFITLLDRLDAAYEPCSGRPQKPLVLVLDNGPIHTSKASRAALAGRAWLRVEWLPKYAPELNDIERSPACPTDQVRGLKAHGAGSGATSSATFSPIRPSAIPSTLTAPFTRRLPT